MHDLVVMFGEDYYCFWKILCDSSGQARGIKNKNYCKLLLITVPGGSRFYKLSVDICDNYQTMAVSVSHVCDPANQSHLRAPCSVTEMMDADC